MTARVINIPNATASVTRTNINDALAALGSTNSGATEPPGSLNNMLWYDTATHILKLKAEVGSDWISIGYFDQSTDTFRIFDDTQLVDASGTATGGVLGDQTTATWQAGTGTTESLVSPAKVRAASLEAIDEEGPIKAFATFNGNNASIYKSKNIQSISRSSDGQYSVTFSNSLADANYTVTGSCQAANANHSTYGFGIVFGTTPTTGGFSCATGETGGTNSVGRYADSPRVSFIVVG